VKIEQLDWVPVYLFIGVCTLSIVFIMKCEDLVWKSPSYLAVLGGNGNT
jgi:hypothetical protein